MRQKILILGGTQEALATAARLVEDGHNVITSLAGRTQQPPTVGGQIRIGGFGGIKGLADYLSKNQIDILIDATHPFAEQISLNAIEAAKQANIPLQNLDRPEWRKSPGDRWIAVSSIDEAIEEIPENARVFLALGSQHIHSFAHRSDVYFAVRMVDPPSEPLPFKQHSLVLGKPGADPQSEINILKEHQISHLICRNSGGAVSFNKVVAARLLSLPVIMIQRPTK